MTEKLIQNVIVAMQDSLTDEQLQKLENVLAINLHGMEVREECTQLVTSERHWERILKLYIASKRLETAPNPHYWHTIGVSRCCSRALIRNPRNNYQ